MKPDKDVLEQRLANIGLDPSLIGFDYIVELLTILDKETLDLMNSYKEIAKRFRTTCSAVDRSIRHAVTCFYRDNDTVPRLLQPNFESGKLPTGQFLYKLRVLLKQDTGFFKDGSAWAILEYMYDRYEVRIFTAGGNYWAHRGTHDACLNYIKNGGNKHVV